MLSPMLPPDPLQRVAGAGLHHVPLLGDGNDGDAELGEDGGEIGHFTL
jgi:hypothetical protein